MGASERSAIRRHEIAKPADVEAAQARSLGQRDRAVGRIATRLPRLIELRRFEELKHYYTYALEIVERGRITPPEPALDLEVIGAAAKYMSIYCEHGTDRDAPDVIASVSIDVGGTTVEVAPTELIDSLFRIYELPFVAVVARDADALDRWGRFDIDRIFFPDRVGFRYMRHFADLYRSVVLYETIDDAAVTAMQAVADSAEEVCAENKSDFSHNIYIHQPLTDALIAVVRNDIDAFRVAMYDANLRHRDYWDRDQQINRGDPPVRVDSRGWMSWPGTAIAALGHDRGLVLDFESDYMPGHLIAGAS